MRYFWALVLALSLSAGFCQGGQAGDVMFIRSDANDDGSVDISDAVFTLVALFWNEGITVTCDDALDADDDGIPGLNDAMRIVGFLFLGDPAPPSPFGLPGCDRSPDSLGCESYGSNAPCDAPEFMIFGHTYTDLAGISTASVGAVKQTFKILYGHTSHGSQILSGMGAMRDDTYNFNDGAGTLSIVELSGDLGNPDFTTWAQTTRSQLSRPSNDRNVVMWSWCGQVSGASEEVIDRDYLGQMAALQEEFPSVRFIYMTGHLDGTGAEGNLNQRNEQIRDFCRANGKVLFDFADIESYDPDGNYYLDMAADDACEYYSGGERRSWAEEWCAANPGQCSSCDCAHSHSLNCDMKARAFWWMMARMAEAESL